MEKKIGVGKGTGSGFGVGSLQDLLSLGPLIVRTFCAYYFVKLPISLFDGVTGQK